jgi:integrase
MADSRVAKEYNYESVLAKPLHDFVAGKRGSGFLYNSESKMLKRFDKFVLGYDQQTCELSQELFKEYTAKTVHDSYRNHLARYTLIRQLSEFMRSQGFSAYVPHEGYALRQKSNFVPYIFTEDELNRLFAVADTYELPIHANNNSKLELILPIIFKMLYGGGFRISELTHLKLSDIDFENGIVKIVHSKFQSERLVPLSASLMELLKTYAEKVHFSQTTDEVFFPKHDGSVYAEKTIYQHFRAFLWQAGISHGGKGNGPRLHDIRHTFAVHRLKYWAGEGLDVSTMLAHLSAYMGHKNLKATGEYLRLTFDVFPDVTKVLESAYGSIIPKISETEVDGDE